ncbi:hypothetical protein [Nocardioides donggukensis]|uniref:Uncharacterized protein n=1 Tax=Nocardioides donggukensis TaxID=2774019 RepID=A0A927KBI1_9ACTN|nr:hypothetical protein [Nocardioides donggukensis]MBD8871135.1 hypothetical protein [Nocardioides donggukensis]
MPTGRSWTDPIADVGSLVRFRFGAARPDRPGGARRTRLLIGIPAAITLAVLLVPAAAAGAGSREGYALDLLVILPTAATAFLLLTIVSAVASGGGRELLSREHGVAYPVSPVTDHLGALLMAPLNIAWLVQGWLLLGLTSYGAGWRALLPAELLMLLFLAAATALGQVVGWSVEAVRRARYGVVAYRGLVVASLALSAWLVATDRLVDVLSASPTVHLAVAVARIQDGEAGYPLAVLGVLVALLVASVLAGIVPATLALRRPPRDEARLESGTHRPRGDARSDLMALARVDLSSVLRSVPLRRGLLTLALLPGLAALGGAIAWDMLILMPGLVASGAALLFGVNAWCLDGRGALWRGSLPVDPDLAFVSRAGVLAGLLMAASAVTIALGSLRAGLPSAAVLVALLCAWLVVTLQVTTASMRWSARAPYAADMRSARATPAPPAVMVGYSARLALSTTLLGLLFSTVAVFGVWWLSVVVAAPLLAWWWRRLGQVRRQWSEPTTRSRVAVTVAA